MASAIADMLSSKKAKDIVMIDIAEKSSFADYFVIATGTSDRQLGALADDVEDKFAELGIDDYITKPFLPLLIKEVVHNMTERTEI